GWAGSIAGISYGLKKTDGSKIVQTALISSAFFLASLVNVRIGPSSTHLSLLAPMGLILGQAVFPAVFVALLLQAVLFQFGGLVVLGANTFAMATSALLVYFVFGRAIRESKHASILAFMAGFSAVMIAAGISGAFLGLTDRNFLGAIKILAAAHVPVAIIEGIVTAFLMTWLKKSSFSFYR
ncbi:MAG: cobalt transporter CbiM, partial [Synergistaceae bacterium]|nr:cobalt transporter CbiM [Synergistaceae bacterium]